MNSSILDLSLLCEQDGTLPHPIRSRVLYEMLRGPKGVDELAQWLQHRYTATFFQGEDALQPEVWVRLAKDCMVCIAVKLSRGEHVIQALQSLTDDERACLLLQTYGGFSLTEIASILKIQDSRALNLLQSAIEKVYDRFLHRK